MLAPNSNQQLVDEGAHGWAVRVNPSHNLRNHGQPRVYADVAESLHQRCLHLWRGAVIEPQRQQAQDILQRPALTLLRRCTPQCNTSEKAADGRCHVAGRRGGGNLGIVLHGRGVEQCPVVPCLGPLPTGVGGGAERSQHVGESVV